MIRSSIDLGTNTCLLLVVDQSTPGETFRVIKDFSTIVRLGQGVDLNRKLHPDAMKRTLDCLKNYAKELSTLGGQPGDTICVATSQARDSANGQEFFDQVFREIGFKFRIISGDEEAQATFRGGLLSGMSPDVSVVIDIGGGSTEYMSVSGGQSLDIGSVRYTERFLKSNPVTDNEFWACQEAIDAEIEQLSNWRRSLKSETQWVAVAGTATTLAAMHLRLEKFDAKQIDEVTLSCGELHRMVEELKWRTHEERAKVPGIEAKRADVILAGAMILWRTLEVWGVKEVRVSTRGLRYGVLSSSG